MFLLQVKKIKERWQAEDGYREVLLVALPLILSTGSWSLQHFIDRVFLTWYSAESIAASLPAGWVNSTIVSLFVGTASYVSTFVAQYYGAKRMKKIGPSVWQGIYLSLLAAIVAIIIYPISGWFFNTIGHPPAVRELEISYFKILLFGAPLLVITNATTGFFSGRGKTFVVMWVNFVATAVNILLDYLLIFGKLGLPQMGIRGAGWATVTSVFISSVLFFGLMIQPEYNRKFYTLKGWRFNWEIFRRLLKYGVPTGLQFMLEVLAFAIFILMVGHIGTNALAASNITFNINTIAFLPMYGMSIAVSILVGQRLGENKPLSAEKVTWSAFHLSFSYFGLLAIGYFFFPGIFLFPFNLKVHPDQFESIRHLAVLLLKFVAIYSIFDASNMIFSAAVKGAGDTRFVACTSIILSWILMIIPSYIALYWFKGGLFWLWGFVTIYIVGLGFIFLWRFLKGPWRSMRVIE